MWVYIWKMDKDAVDKDFLFAAIKDAALHTQEHKRAAKDIPIVHLQT